VIKLTFCLTRVSHLTREQFQRYWLESHGPLVRSFAPALRIKRYVQSHALTTPIDDRLRRGRGAPDGYDGVAELWWDSLEDLTAGGASPEGREAGRRLVDDERTFIDLARSPLWLAEEHPLV
jgi:uncharacterized protein (TIGR02118 family)